MPEKGDSVGGKDEAKKSVDVKAVADFLRGSSGVRLKPAKQCGKKVYYFKGKRMVECLLNEESTAKHKQPILSEADAIRVGRQLLRGKFIYRSRILNAQKKELQPTTSEVFDPAGLYLWEYEPTGTRIWNRVLTFTIIALFLACTMFPLWPRSSKVGIWYVSVTLLILITGFNIIRWGLFVFFWIFGLDFWIMPNLYRDDLPFMDSFKPLWSGEPSEGGQRNYRLGVFIAIAAFAYWCYIQPTEFDEFVAGSKKFTEDLYSGNLLSDMSQHAKDNVDTVVPDIDELMRDDEEIDDGLGEVSLDMEEEGDVTMEEDIDEEDLPMIERLKRKEARKNEESKKAREANDAKREQAADVEETEEVDE